MPTYNLLVDLAALNLGHDVLRAVFALKRASVVDSFVIVPDLKLTALVIDNENFTVSLLPNTPGSVYEVVLYGDKTELLRAFFIMPAQDSNLHELTLLTAYPEMNSVLATFLQLSDTPNNYVGHAGKLVAVKQDETGLEFVNSDPEGCVPSAPFEFTAGRDQLVSHKRLTFRINGSPPSIFTGLQQVGDDDADINFEDYFYRFGAANRVEGNYFIISTSGGNQGAFRIGFDSESGQAIISARDDSYNPLSTTLELIATDHPDDFATHYFGGSVTLHACGINEPA